jgi:hypothetical protein
MIKIFLSYAREDLVAARELFVHLNRYPGVDVWFDKESLIAGERWEQAIRKAIRESRYFILLLSEKSVAKKGYYQKEVRLALEILDEYPDDEIFLVPVRVDNCAPRLERLNSLQYVDLFPNIENGLNKIYELLQLHSRKLSQHGTSGKLRLTSHQARFIVKPDMFYFVTATNLSDKPIELTHVWYEDISGYILANPKSRPLPARLEVNSSWTTWIAVEALLKNQQNAYDKFRARLSTGETFVSHKDDTVPPMGSVSGGPIDDSDLL